MACYLLLRNNTETGPFTLDELTASNLKPNDLIWIEGQSTVWKYPAEIAVLQGFVTEAPAIIQNPPVSQVIETSKGIFVALPPQFLGKRVDETFVAHSESVDLESRLLQPLETLPEKSKPAQQPATFRKRKTFSKPHNVLWVGCVFAGLLFSAVLIKDIVETYDANVSTYSAAALPAIDRNNLKEQPEENLYQNALTTEIVPVDTLTMKPVKKVPVRLNLKKLVQLEANDYQVGLFGGIKHLRMLVINKSAYLLDKVKFELQYLKPNGDVLKTERITMRSVAPRSSKSQAIPSKNRGVKVAYHILDVQSRQNSDALVNL